MSPSELAEVDAAARAREEEDEEEERRKEEEARKEDEEESGDEDENEEEGSDRKGQVVDGNGYTMHKAPTGTVPYGDRHDVAKHPAPAPEDAQPEAGEGHYDRWDGGMWSWGGNTGLATGTDGRVRRGGRQAEVENEDEAEDKAEKTETKAQPQQDDDDVSSITSTTIPFYDSGSDGPAENRVDPELERAPEGPEPPVDTAVIDKATGKPLTTNGHIDDSASELTAFTDESEGEANEDDNEDDDDDEEEEEEEVEVKPGGGSVPPPNLTTNATTKSSPAQGGQKPLSARKPSIFGPRSDEPDVQDDGEESELTDSDVESTLTATTRNKTATNTASNGNKGAIKPISIKVTPAKSIEGDDVDAEDEDEPMTPGTTAVRVPAPRGSSKVAGDDEEKPYSPPKTAKKGILGRSAAGQADGETESIVSDDEEEDDDEGGQGMLVKDAVRRESEGKAKKTREDDEDDEDKGVTEERSVEGRGECGIRASFFANVADMCILVCVAIAASPSSSKSKRVSATPAPSSTSHLITNNLSSATTQTTLEALQSLLQIEVKFAALRDQLYVERMDELSREEEVIADGQSFV